MGLNYVITATPGHRHLVFRHRLAIAPHLPNDNVDSNSKSRRHPQSDPHNYIFGAEQLTLLRNESDVDSSGSSALKIESLIEKGQVLNWDAIETSGIQL